MRNIMKNEVVQYVVFFAAAFVVMYFGTYYGLRLHG